jgi:hypothetical protein
MYDSLYLSTDVFVISGEKLSKQQLQSNNAIKKLRAKEKDTDAVIKTQK